MYKIIVTWRDYVNLDPFVYYEETLQRANHVAALQRRRPESLFVSVEEV